ncbi:MAG: hypothetical protein H0T62_12210 [Parachlamydiaceae bacterium]|nr:hypothetical protein [Parachlamydiaceae bacterium]
MALDLQKINAHIGGWRFIPKKGSKEEGAQIDLLFDREDGVITLCEIKNSEHPFSVDKANAKQLAQKMTVLKSILL